MSAMCAWEKKEHDSSEMSLKTETQHQECMRKQQQSYASVSRDMNRKHDPREI